MKHYTYIIENLTNGKKYYGVRSSPSIDSDGYMGSSLYLKRDIEKLGLQFFTKTVDLIFDTREEANLYEYSYIKNNNLVSDKMWYNESYGGSNFNTFGKVPVIDTHTNEVMLISSEDFDKTRYVSVLKNKPSKLKGRKWEEYLDMSNVIERKTKLSEKNKGEGNPMYGTTHTEEWRKNHSDKMKGDNNPMYGKEQKQSTRDKISKANSKWDYQVLREGSDVWESKSLKEMSDEFGLKQATLIKYTMNNITICNSMLRYINSKIAKENVIKIMNYRFRAISLNLQE